MKKLSIFYYNLIILTITLLLMEGIFKVVSNNNLISLSTIRIIIGIFCISLPISYLYTFINTKYIPKINIIIVSILTFYAFLQVGFNNYIGVYMSFNVTSQAGAVVSYIFEYFKSFYWYYYLLLLPPILLSGYYLFFEKKLFSNKKYEKESSLLNIFRFVSLILVVVFSYYLTISTDLFQNQYQIIRNYELFKTVSNPSIAIREFGSTMFGLIDVKNFVIDLEEKDEIINEGNYAYNENNKNSNRAKDDSKWMQLIEDEDELMYNYLNYYYINNQLTNENSYTGLFEDKNLIVIMMESVNDIFINPDLYPNFYKLLNEGFYFKNNYSPRNSCATGNNELSGMIGLYSIYNKCTANAYSSNLYPESLFNLFNRAGYKTTSMHNYTEKYYARKDIHLNMGSGRYYDVIDLGIEYDIPGEEWSSDEDFMNEVVKILSNYSNNDKFMTWLTTVSGHQPYGSSILGDKYLYLFDDTNYDIRLQRYMSKLKVLDEGLGILLKGLKDQGKLDDTVIVLFGDHYPYGLSNRTLSTALPYSITEEYENERVPFVIWSSDIEGTTYKQYTSYVNILPTLSNLFNLDYDPRYYTGRDLLSKEYESMVIFANGSWKNEYAFYNASNSRITYYTNKEYTLDEVIAINEKVADKIKYSNLAIQHNYFDYLYNNLK